MEGKYKVDKLDPLLKSPNLGVTHIISTYISSWQELVAQQHFAKGPGKCSPSRAATILCYGRETWNFDGQLDISSPPCLLTVY